MVGSKLLSLNAFAVVMLVATTILIGTASAASAGQPICSDYENATHGCLSVGGSTAGGGVKLEGGFDSNSESSRPSGSSWQQGDQTPPATLLPPDETPFYTDDCNPRCEFTINNDEGDDGDAAGGVVVDLNDIARFRPTVGVDRMEPNGWMVIDLPANFYSRGGVVVKAGELLDRDALVRFTPVRWHWDYGDGSQRTSVDPGASWKTLGVDEFEPTGTSHMFDHAGTFEIQLTIFYAAEYQFDGNGWIPIAGVLPVPSNAIEARAVTAKTVLVAEDCTDNPTGPGC